MNRYKNKRRLKLVTLLFVLSLLSSSAFAATNGMLTFGGTVRINHVAVIADEMRLEFINTSTRWVSSGDAEVRVSSDIADTARQGIIFDIQFINVTPGDFDTRAEVYFQFENTGTVPVRLLDFDEAVNGPQLDFQLQGGFGIGSVVAPGQIVDGFVVVGVGDFPVSEDAVNYTYQFALSYEMG
ncbi:MAG: hypothetical protein FWD03_10480, partial [Defluviitaleaceae bacterium]|nr:hypothetical protein [Defluviitaleaceae bacterium]